MSDAHLERLVAAFERLSDGSDLWWVVVVVLTSGLSAFLGSYLQKKGSNFATKEDTGKITKIVEEVRSGFQKEIEAMRERKELRVAAVDRRLQAHQEAFTLWRGLRSSVHEEEVGTVARECEEWWNKNCIYLDEKSRAAFRTAYMSAYEHKGCLDADRASGKSEFTSENWERIVSAGGIIVTGADLPSLGESESVFLEKDKSNQPVLKRPKGGLSDFKTFDKTDP